ncbi:hypothetical protein FF36_05321 [Frankia torreyi]|uniref:Pycsar effector protein domain-containing protein n=1 Tax=Frankia torreyi TaxID=1856 RepID=A0A0D8BAF8_9ACTN|nr:MULTISPECIES: hypothetical protein [Frankia]KJE20347.1 hypothetical protein FF36_05321 [Frankia torreyi]
MSRVTRTTVETRMRTRTDLITSMRAEAARSDGQVGIVMAGATAAAGFLVTSWSPGSLPVTVAVLWWIGMAATGAGIAALGGSLCPSIPRETGVPAAAFHCWHAVRAARAGVLTAVLDRTPVDIDAADRQTEGLAAVVAIKWARNRTGLRLLGVALVAFAAAGITGQVVAA